MDRYAWLWIVVAGLTVGVVMPTDAMGEGPRRQAADQLQQALEVGFEAGADRATEAERLLAGAECAVPGDPRVAYGAGLIGLKQHHSTQAAAAFEKAVRLAKEPYWPAWEAWVWIAARGRTLPATTDRLQGLLERVMEDPEREGSRERIVWVGRVLGGMRQGELSAASSQILNAAENRLRTTLGPEWIRDFETGLAEVERTVEELSEMGREANEVVANRKRKAAAVVVAKLEGGLEKAATTREVNQRTHDDWKKWLEKQLKPIDKELAVHEKDFEYLSRRRESVNQSIVLVGREISQLESTGGNAFGSNRARLRQQLDTRNQEMARYRIELAATEGEMLRTVQSGNVVALRRRQVVGHYDQATGKLVEQRAQADKWTERLAARKARVKGSAAKAAAPSPRIAFSTLVPFDPEERKRMLIDELAEE